MGLFSSSDNTNEKKRAQKYRDMIRKEAVLGGTVFGPVAKGVRREFFCLDSHTWVWHEEWTDHTGKRHIQTTRYDIRKDGVVKCQNDGPYMRLSPAEFQNLYKAAQRYTDLVTKEVYPKYRQHYEMFTQKMNQQDYSTAA